MQLGIRRKVGIELLVLIFLTSIFLLLFPIRPVALDLSLAGVALAMIGLTKGYSKSIWRSVGSEPPPNHIARCVAVTARVSMPPLLVFLIIGFGIGFKDGGWPKALHRVFDWHLLAVFCLYAAWALLQQTLFQFYLLGRLCVLLPRVSPLIVCTFNGIVYGLVHLPDVWTTLATVLGVLFGV